MRWDGQFPFSLPYFLSQFAENSLVPIFMKLVRPLSRTVREINPASVRYWTPTTVMVDKCTLVFSLSPRAKMQRCFELPFTIYENRFRNFRDAEDNLWRSSVAVSPRFFRRHSLHWWEGNCCGWTPSTSDEKVAVMKTVSRDQRSCVTLLAEGLQWSYMAVHRIITETLNMRFLLKYWNIANSLILDKMRRVTYLSIYCLFLL